MDPQQTHAPQPMVSALRALYEPLAPYAYAFMRFCVGATIVPHGYTKLFQGTVAPAAGMIAKLGLEPALAWAYFVGGVDPKSVRPGWSGQVRSAKPASGGTAVGLPPPLSLSSVSADAHASGWNAGSARVKPPNAPKRGVFLHLFWREQFDRRKMIFQVGIEKLPLDFRDRGDLRFQRRLSDGPVSKTSVEFHFLSDDSLPNRDRFQLHRPE